MMLSKLFQALNNKHMETTIRRYIRKENKEPRGVVVAVRDGDEIKYGYSLVNSTAEQFSKKRGVMIATKRALSNGYSLPDVPEREKLVTDAFTIIEKRAIKYFKDVSIENIKLDIIHPDIPYLED